MADTSIGVVAADGTTKQIDTHTQPNGDNREAVVVGDPVDTTVARVLATAPTGTEGASLVRQVGSLPLSYAPAVARAAVSPSTASVVAMAARPGRVWATIRNATNGTVYLSFTDAAVVAGADFRILPEGVAEFPSGSGFRITQAVNAIWEVAATGTLNVTEWF